MPEKKFYVVWKGNQPGVYASWAECKKQVEGYNGALYKSFKSFTEAQIAFKKGLSGFNAKQNNPNASSELKHQSALQPIRNSIAVDGAWNTKTLQSEYRGVEVSSGRQLFIRGPFAEGTNNVMEFLALVHALAYCKKHGLRIPVYSDSITAIKWVRDKKANTKLNASSGNVELFSLLERAEHWLKTNTYSNPILKWETQLWGENPADFGRK
jgi:ribonuclease HI